MKRSKILLGIVFIIMILTGCFSVTTIVLAQNTGTQTTDSDYTPLAPLPGTFVTTTGKTTLQTYLPNLFNLMIGMAAVIAFVVIVWGGITYATTDSFFGKEEGKKHITNAIWGLLLVIGSWVILYTINPQILNFDLVLPRANLPTSETINVGTPMTAAEKEESARIAALLGQNNNPCASGQTTNCVNFNGLQPKVITALNNLSRDCGGCTIRITAGTESGHSVGSLHGTGFAVDIASNSTLDAKIKTGTRSINVAGCTVYSYQGGTYMWEQKGKTCGGTVVSTGDHWHVSF